ncbi:hypothetical protein BGX27_009555 [Mortierella sp. AM989]|nr:hypothetical protein BGX27_009555 [Mortierella sp. AM989]
MSQDTAPATQVEVEEDGTKVFVGNLSFQTTEAELAETFSKPTPVMRANIITRGTRSLGYGFVAYETLEQAKVAAETYNKTLLGGREINVEVAKRRVERTPAAPKEKTPKQPKESNKDSAESGDAAIEVKPRTSRSNRSRSKRTNKNKTRNEGEEGITDETASAPSGANGEATKDAKEGAKEGARRKRNNRRSTRKGANDDAVTAVAGEGAFSTPSAPRPVGPPSKTTVFVANLPFAMEDDGLMDLFAEFKVASAHVVRRRASGRSKGFGFVELVDEAEQLNVLEKMKDAKADGRDLVIKIALSEEQIPEKENTEKDTA